jgi:hypothetical protein
MEDLVKITCVDLDQFVRVCAMLVERGITFEAHGYDYTIDLKGF